MAYHMGNKDDTNLHTQLNPACSVWHLLDGGTQQDMLQLCAWTLCIFFLFVNELHPREMHVAFTRPELLAAVGTL